jgi:hypothetical protein
MQHSCTSDVHAGGRGKDVGVTEHVSAILANEPESSATLARSSN